MNRTASIWPNDGRLFVCCTTSSKKTLRSAFPIFFLIVLLTASLLLSTTETRAEDTAIQQKESELQKARTDAEAARTDIRSAHPGDTRPPEVIIQGDIAFENLIHQKLVDAKTKLATFDVIRGAAQLAGDAAEEALLESTNKKLAPFFTLDKSGNLLLGPAFIGLPIQFPTPSGLSVEGTRDLLNTMINDNAAMRQKREDQLAALGNERALENELDQLKKQQQRKKIVRFWVECSPDEIGKGQSSLCSTNVEFEDGSFDKFNNRVTWSGASGGVVSGDSAAPGTTVTVSATYRAAPEEGGGNWSGSDRVRIRPDPPQPPAPPPLPAQGSTTGTTPTTGPVQQPPVQDTGDGQSGGGSDDPTREPPPPPPPPIFRAELDCPPSFELVPGDFVGKGCGIIVRGWDPGGPRVVVDVDFPERSGIEIFPGDTSADASQMHNPGVSDFHDRYVFSESIRAKETAPPGVTTVRFTVSQGAARVVLTLQISILQKGQVPSPTGIRPQVNMATGGGKDAKYCVWRYRALYEPPECFLFAKAECFKYGPPKYELVGQMMTWMQSEALMSRLSRYGGDAYGCLKAQNEQWQRGQGPQGGDGGQPPPDDDDKKPDQPEEPPQEPPQEDDTGDTGGDNDACRSDNDCPTGYVCDAGRCAEPFDQNYTTAANILGQREDQRDEDVIDRNIADQGSSTTGSGFTSSDLDEDMEATQEAVSSGCRSDSDCPSGQHCENGTCGGGQHCSTDADCPHGSTCSQGSCTGAATGSGQQGLTISPANKVAEINEPVTFQASAGGTDVTSQTTWTPGNPFSSGSIGQYTVNATYQNLSGSATVNVVEKKGMDDITVNTRTFTVSFYDHETVDGDMIDILVNNKAVFSGITLTKAPQSRTITMQEDVIVLGFKALNEGDIPPNTATVTFSGVVQGKSNQVYTLEKNQKTNMNVTFRP